MRLDKLPGYGLPELAVWPQPFYGGDSWIMYSLKLRNDNTLHWYRRYVGREGKQNLAFCNIYGDYSEATTAASEINDGLAGFIDSLNLASLDRNSLRLKVDKALTAKSRLMNEEQLMLDVAIRKHAKVIKIKPADINLASEAEVFRDSLSDLLVQMPYLQFAYIRKNHASLMLDEDGVWNYINMHGEKAAKAFYQERIARGYGLSGFSHWGKTKSAIRAMLLPRANELLQLSSVKRMLAEAEKKRSKSYFD